jgi:hypothetical protein
MNEQHWKSEFFYKFLGLSINRFRNTNEDMDLDKLIDLANQETNACYKYAGNEDPIKIAEYEFDELTISS